ncbi:hypothetical protein [uncultured Arenimonas sp.]|uniref:hypothetical protein n=1 Tax=uncultured Arenimonas sp. TaxID=546226 RepID=UPI0030DC6CA8
MSAGRALALAAIVVVIAALGMGLWASGSPSTQREFRLDERRIRDLQAITTAVEGHYRNQAELPANLDLLADAPGSRLSIADPVSGEGYDYEIVDQHRYRICATFTHDTSRATDEAIRSGASWWHGSGPHCFDRRVQEEQD